MRIGDSFVISPDEPHAYISGDLIEAMVCSDNVVRGGLTPKFKDTKTLEMVSTFHQFYLLLRCSNTNSRRENKIRE